MSVAVVMTCYNEGPYIEQAVRSVLRQTRADAIEAIVVADDGSDEATRTVLAGLEALDGRIRILYGPGGAGPAANRNLAAGRSAAPLIAFLDGDDLWEPAKLEKQMAFLEQRPDVGLVYTGYYSFYEMDMTGARRAHVKDLLGAADLTLGYFLSDPPILPSTVMVRRAVFDAVDGFDPRIRVFEETDLHLRLSRFTRFAALDEPLIYKRNRAASITGQKKTLLAHHAYVALKAAAEDTRLLPLVPKRLAVRARKLGNVLYYQGAVQDAARCFGFSLRLNPTDPMAWAGWAVAGLGGKAGRKLLQPLLASRSATFQSGQ